jgi:aminoglycoside phosphotransferase (APT) family kinase protein
MSELLGIDLDAVSTWLDEHVRGEPPYRFEPILGGSSNLTYEVIDTAGGRWVLRRPPVNSVIASAHDMAREHRVMHALGPTPVPVPRMFGLCTDDEVTGATFYVMEHVDGIYMDDEAGGRQLDPAGRRRAGESFVDALAALHAVDPDAVGLGDLGRRDGYVARQIKRWFGQWEQMHTLDRPVVREVHDTLLRLLPPDRGRSGVVHGDFSFRNCRFAHDGPVRAVLDWEISTLGDPLADIGYVVAAWSDEPGTLHALDGFPTRDEVVERYASATGLDVSELPFYIAFNHWKTACIIEGVFARYQAGALGEERKAEGDRFGLLIDLRAEQARSELAAL